MWQPTHVKVTVKQARSLITKGKNGTNDVFVVIGIGKEKYQTSIKEKSLPTVEWREECELAIPSQGNVANIQLTVYHHNTIGLDEFLGQVVLPLSEFDVYSKPKYRSYRLKGKPEKDKKKGEKERGELEVMINFTVKSGSNFDISKKEKQKSSLTSLKHIGGSLMSIGAKEKQGLKNFAKSVSSKMDKIAKPRRKKSKTPSENSSSGLSNDLLTSQQRYGDADPGVISDDDDDDFKFDDDVKVNTRTSSPMSTMSRGSSLMHDQVLDTVTGSTENVSINGSRSSLNTSRESSIHDVRKEDSFTRLPEVKALTLEKMSVIELEDDNGKKQKRKPKTGFKNRFFNKTGGSRERLNEDSRFVEGGNDRLPTIPSRHSKLPQEVHDKFAGKSREDLLEVILNLQSTLEKQVKHSSDLEEYLDNLLLRVMEATPHILQAPVKTGPAFKYDRQALGYF